MEDSKDLARALRRHHAVRLKHVRKSYWGRIWGSAYYEPLTERQLGMLLSTTHLCSGVCCGNPRRWLGERTIQEQRTYQHTLAELLNDTPD